MNSITQDMKFRLSLIKYADKHSVTKAAIKYKTNRQYIYRWKALLSKNPRLIGLDGNSKMGI